MIAEDDKEIELRGHNIGLDPTGPRKATWTWGERQMEEKKSQCSLEAQGAKPDLSSNVWSEKTDSWIIPSHLAQTHRRIPTPSQS